MAIALKWEGFQRILPFRSEFFTSTKNTPLSDATLNFITQYLAQSLPDDVGFKIPDEKSSNINLHFQAEECGGMMTCLEYERKDNDGLSHTYISVVVGEICMQTAATDKISIVPHYVLAGEKKLVESEETLLIEVLACRALQPGRDKPVMVECDPHNEGDLSEALCYADDCFRRISSGLPLDIMAAQAWFDTSDEDLNNRMQFLISRSEKQLAKEISQLQKQASIDSVAKFQMPAPTAFQ